MNDKASLLFETIFVNLIFKSLRSHFEKAGFWEVSG